mgnify:CR=1 FL=1
MIKLTDENFEKEIQNIDKPVLVDFFAPWCAPCSVLAPILEKLAEDSEGKFILTKVNLDEIPQTSQKFGIDRIPTVILFKKGKAISGFVGLRPEKFIKEWLENMLNENENPNVSVQEKIEKLVKEIAGYAEQKGFKLSPNKEVVEKIVKGLLENEKKYGKRYCPCRRITGNPEEDSKNICPCIYHLEELAKNGHCLCGLFVK